MSKTIEVTYYTTPRHGYFEVKGEDLRDLKISQSFSEYSYYDEDNDIFYLEEDCDLMTFVEAYRSTYENEPEWEVHHSNRDSRIRSYERYDSYYQEHRQNKIEELYPEGANVAETPLGEQIDGGGELGD